MLPDVIARTLNSPTQGARHHPAGNRESLQRRRHWWLPYVVIDFDNNQIPIDALGGDLQSPTWFSKVTL